MKETMILIMISGMNYLFEGDKQGSPTVRTRNREEKN